MICLTLPTSHPPPQRGRQQLWQEHFEDVHERIQRRPPCFSSLLKHCRNFNQLFDVYAVQEEHIFDTFSSFSSVCRGIQIRCERFGKGAVGQGRLAAIRRLQESQKRSEQRATRPAGAETIPNQGTAAPLSCSKLFGATPASAVSKPYFCYFWNLVFPWQAAGDVWLITSRQLDPEHTSTCAG